MIHLLHRASQVTEERLSALAPTTPTPRQLLVLQALSHMEKMSQTNIVQATGVDRSTISDIIKRLVRNGWVKRKRSTLDARVQVVELTEGGRAAIDVASNALAVAESEVLAMISVQYRQPLLDALNEIREATLSLKPSKRHLEGEMPRNGSSRYSPR